MWTPANVCPALLALQLFCLHLPTASSIAGSKDSHFFAIRPCVSLTILTSAHFHYADEGLVKQRSLGMRGCMLLLCTILLWHPCSSRHTPPSPTHTSSLQSVTFSIYRGHMHDEITHQALGPVFIMYEWVYPLGAWCPGWGKPENQGEAQRLSAADWAVAGVGGAGSSTARQRPGSGLVHALCWLPSWCASSQSGSASDKPPVEVSCADSETEQRVEKRVEQHTCPCHWAKSRSSTAHLWILC